MTDKNEKSSLSDAEKALEIENASYIDVEPETTFEPSTAEPDKHEPVVQVKQTKTGFLWFVTLINLIILILAIAAGYWFWMQWQSGQTEQQTFLVEQRERLALQDASNGTLQRTINDKARELDAQVASLSRQIEAQQQNITKLESDATQALDKANANSRSIEDVSGRRPSDWLLAEADYLVRMAGRKLWLEKDVKTAILMLESADMRLQDLADPSLLPVRQFIASDIQTLQQINPVSLTSVALAVSGMIQQVNSLPLALPELEVASTNLQEDSGWDRFVNYILANFRYESKGEEGQPLKPLLNEQQQWLAREQLKYSLLQAQHAVVNEQSTLFDQSLQRALGTLVDHYDLEDQTVDQFIGSLKNLQNTPVERKYPTQLDAAQPLKERLESRMNRSNSSGTFEL